MKTLGLIGGMSWESSLEYYRYLNELVKDKLGGAHSCELIMYSVDFAKFKTLQHQGQWGKIAEQLINNAQKLEKAGAEILLICTNTMHRVAPEIENNIDITLFHIADAAAEAIKEKNISKVGLLGTKFTMLGDFYRRRLEDKHDIEVFIPNKDDREVIHQTIFQELISGIIKEDSRKEFVRIINRLKERGAEGVILGCTEIPLLIKEKHSPIPIFATSYLHAEKALDMAIK